MNQAFFSFILIVLLVIPYQITVLKNALVLLPFLYVVFPWSFSGNKFAAFKLW